MSAYPDDTPDRRAPADLWRRTLSQIPSVFGRLTYLSALRGAGGIYEHHGFIERFGEAAAQAALLHSHEEAFQSWLTFSLEEQKADLDLYLSERISERRNVVETWLRSAPWRSLLPATARESERRLFEIDFEMLLELLAKEFKLERLDPEE